MRQIRSVKAFSRTPERREEFSRRMSESLGVEITPVASSAKESVRDTDIVIVITNVRTLDPVLFGDWLEPGMHINAAGANSITRRELDSQGSNHVLRDSRGRRGPSQAGVRRPRRAR